ncbi:uncharacterized protein [Temnothorax longispinosus]|uniref:uncharacterized protein n=1 Tax=Temnothorax longispinosus TaxID=300112 RepID=UPI003A9A5DD7
MFNLSSDFQGRPKNKQKERRWRPFHAKDFQSLMCPCFMFLRILGIFPYKINASTFEASKPYYILSAVVTCVCGIYALITLLNFSLLGRIIVFAISENLAIGCVFVFGSFIMIVTFILSGPRMRLLQTILKISSRLPSESYQKLSKLIHAKDIIGFLYQVMAIILICASTLNINLLFKLYIYLVVFQMDMLYMNCVCILKICFKKINDDLMHMRELMTYDNPHSSRSIYHEQRNPFLIMELKAMKKEHLTISDTVQMLNKIFSLQLLATVAMTFSDITINLFYYIVTIQDNMIVLSRDNFLIYSVYFFLYMTYLFKGIVLIVWACETGNEQALQISTSIHDVFNNTTDKQIKNELQIFSLQTLHCDNTFSAKGFTVNAKLLVVIVGTIATYALILYQFLHLPNSCERETTNWKLLDVILTSMAFYSMRIMLLVWACETGKNQANEIGTTIHDVLNSTRDEQIKDELRLFSLQIMHCKNTFLTKGLTMDATLLTAVSNQLF